VCTNARCTSGVCSVTTRPCDGLCVNPTVYAGPSYTSGGLGSLAGCFETTSTLLGGTCLNFATGRTFAVNGTLMTCGVNWTSVPAARNGGYCLVYSAGGYDYASFATWGP
jgi:hypothetical protein